MKFTEQLWQTDTRHALAMFDFVKKRLSRRKTYLLAVQGYRRRWPASADRPELEVAERYVDGTCEEAEFVEARRVVYSAVTAGEVGSPAHQLTQLFNFNLRDGAQTLAWYMVRDHPAGCDLVREIAGNPFRPWKSIPEAMGGGLVQPDGATVFPSAAAHAIAAGVAADQAFDRLPVLADALEDAGCDSEPLLTHLRGPGPHVRGCWALDAVLGL